jgi:hypothetical protein
MPDLLGLPSELLLDITGLLSLSNVNNLTQTNRCLYSRLNLLFYTLVPPYLVLYVIYTNNLAAFQRIISYNLLRHSTALNGDPPFVWVAHRRPLLSSLLDAGLLDATEWCFIIWEVIKKSSETDSGD